MAKVTLNGAGKTNIKLDETVSYVFNPSNADILSVKIGTEYFRPDKIADILNGFTSVLWKKNRSISTYKKVAEGWESAYKEKNVAYKRLKRIIFIGGLILLLGGVLQLLL